MTTHYVSFSAEINPTTTENLITVMANLHNQGATEVHLLFSTPGGGVMNGFNIYNVLRALPFKLITHNVGNVDSIGNVIFLAGVERYACPSATFMFHGVGYDGFGGIRVEEKLLRERLDSIVADHVRMGTVLARHTQLDAGDVAKLFEEATTKDTAWAMSVGIIHAVSEPNVPLGVPVTSFIFNR